MRRTLAALALTLAPVYVSGHQEVQRIGTINNHQPVVNFVVQGNTVQINRNTGIPISLDDVILKNPGEKSDWEAYVARRGSQAGGPLQHDIHVHDGSSTTDLGTREITSIMNGGGSKQIQFPSDAISWEVITPQQAASLDTSLVQQALANHGLQVEVMGTYRHPQLSAIVAEYPGGKYIIGEGFFDFAKKLGKTKQGVSSVLPDAFSSWIMGKAHYDQGKKWLAQASALLNRDTTRKAAIQSRYKNLVADLSCLSSAFDANSNTTNLLAQCGVMASSMVGQLRSLYKEAGEFQRTAQAGFQYANAVARLFFHATKKLESPLLAVTQEDVQAYNALAQLRNAQAAQFRSHHYFSTNLRVVDGSDPTVAVSAAHRKIKVFMTERLQQADLVQRIADGVKAYERRAGWRELDTEQQGYFKSAYQGLEQLAGRLRTFRIVEATEFDDARKVSYTLDQQFLAYVAANAASRQTVIASSVSQPPPLPELQGPPADRQLTRTDVTAASSDQAPTPIDTEQYRQSRSQGRGRQYGSPNLEGRFPQDVAVSSSVFDTGPLTIDGDGYEQAKTRSIETAAARVSRYETLPERHPTATPRVSPIVAKHIDLDVTKAIANQEWDSLVMYASGDGERTHEVSEALRRYVSDNYRVAVGLIVSQDGVERNLGISTHADGRCLLNGSMNAIFAATSLEEQIALVKGARQLPSEQESGWVELMAGAAREALGGYNHARFVCPGSDFSIRLVGNGTTDGVLELNDGSGRISYMPVGHAVAAFFSRQN